MWIFTEAGFVAIAKFDPEREGAQEFLNDVGRGRFDMRQDLWLVRARRKEHLEQFAGRLGNPPRIVTADDADYQYRTLLDARSISLLVSRAVLEMDYGSLKKAVLHAEPRDKDYYDTLNLVWWDVLEGLDERGLEGNPLTRVYARDAVLFGDEEV